LAVNLHNPSVYDVIMMTHVTFLRDIHSTAKELEVKYKQISEDVLKDKNLINTVKPCWNLIKTDDTKKPFSELLGD